MNRLDRVLAGFEAWSADHHVPPDSLERMIVALAPLSVYGTRAFLPGTGCDAPTMTK